MGLKLVLSLSDVYGRVHRLLTRTARGTGGALTKGNRARSAWGVLKLVGRYSNGQGWADLSALFFKSPTETGAALG